MALRNQEIGARLRDLRGSRPQTLIADHLGVAERTWQNWEAGDAKPSWRNLQRIANYFKVTEEFVLTGAEGGRDLPADAASGAQVDGVAVEFRGHVGDLEARLNEILDTTRATFELLQQASDARHAQQEQILQRIEALEQAIISNGQDVATEAVGQVRDLLTEDDGRLDAAIRAAVESLRESAAPASPATARTS